LLANQELVTQSIIEPNSKQGKPEGKGNLLLNALMFQPNDSDMKFSQDSSASNIGFRGKPDHDSDNSESSMAKGNIHRTSKDTHAQSKPVIQPGEIIRRERGPGQGAVIPRSSKDDLSRSQRQSLQPVLDKAAAGQPQFSHHFIRQRMEEWPNANFKGPSRAMPEAIVNGVFSGQYHQFAKNAGHYPGIGDLRPLPETQLRMGDMLKKRKPTKTKKDLADQADSESIEEEEMHFRKGQNIKGINSNVREQHYEKRVNERNMIPSRGLSGLDTVYRGEKAQGAGLKVSMRNQMVGFLSYTGHRKCFGSKCT
jgi:hypothetical protein